MKFVEPSHFTDPDAAARKLLEIANTTEPAQDGASEALVGHVVPVLGAGDVLEQRRGAAAMSSHLGRVGDHLDVAVHVGGELVNHPQGRSSLA
jgi:3,4-dihydroxy-2-butanone 4-phosphate synthase